MTTTAYEFTRFKADFTTKVKAQSYDVEVVRYQIMYNNPKKNFKDSVQYNEALDMFMDLTMSCSRKEAIGWTAYWMSNAIAYGIVTKNLDWMDKFLAAYDLHKQLCGNN